VVKVKLVMLVALGVPEITPVLAFSDNPGGRAPAVIAYVYGAVPPVAASFSEYGAPIVALPPDPQFPHSMSSIGVVPHANATVGGVELKEPVQFDPPLPLPPLVNTLPRPENSGAPAWSLELYELHDDTLCPGLIIMPL